MRDQNLAHCPAWLPFLGDSRDGHTFASCVGMEDPGQNRCTLPPLPQGELTERILRCFFKVSWDLGYGFSEAVLRRAMAIALEEAGMHVVQEMPMHVHYRGRVIGEFYADLVVDNLILVEIKASAALDGYAQAQLLNYLKAAGGGIGLLLNFGRRPEFKRMVMGDPVMSLPNLPK
jgi:GxxExxY protein